MKSNGNTILITGGSSGIGIALAQRFVAAGNEVIVTGRREATLREAKEKIPGLHAIVNDVSSAEERIQLMHRVVAEYPGFNVLINNAGIQRRVDLRAPAGWDEIASEIDVNLAGPIHLSMLAIAHLLHQDVPRIINVSSALGFVPLAPVPIYCATKAAVHSFTQSLRHQLRDTPIKVSEVVPPAVKTNLGGVHAFGENLDAFADSIVEQLWADVPEAGFAYSTRMMRASRGELDQIFDTMNAGFAKAPLP